MCKPRVFKTSEMWEWECKDHSYAVFDYRSQDEALMAALVHQDSTPPPIMMTTKVVRLLLSNSPRLTHLFDQFMGEVEALGEAAHVPEIGFETEGDSSVGRGNFLT